MLILRTDLERLPQVGGGGGGEVLQQVGLAHRVRVQVRQQQRRGARHHGRQLAQVHLLLRQEHARAQAVALYVLLQLCLAPTLFAAEVALIRSYACVNYFMLIQIPFVGELLPTVFACKI